jgi:TonB family protein
LHIVTGIVVSAHPRTHMPVEVPMLNFLAAPAGALAMLVCLAGSPLPPLPGTVGVVRADSVMPAALDDAEYARLRARMQREYPGLMRDARVNGEVVLRFVVRADGTVDRLSVAVLRSSDDGGLFASAARQALQPLRFYPATRDGVAVPATLEATFNFVVDGRQEATFRAAPGS